MRVLLADHVSELYKKILQYTVERFLSWVCFHFVLAWRCDHISFQSGVSPFVGEGVQCTDKSSADQCTFLSLCYSRIFTGGGGEGSGGGFGMVY